MTSTSTALAWRYLHLPTVPPLIRHWQHTSASTSTHDSVCVWLRRDR
jgi:hypothetical protein